MARNIEKLRKNRIVPKTIDFVDNSGSRTNIGNTKPYGMDMTIENIIIDQVVYPYFMITSIKKDLTKVNIECVQLHALAPSEYDDWEIAESSSAPWMNGGGDWIIMHRADQVLNTE